jgi:hypothetical protein
VTLATWASIRHRQLKVVRDRGKAVLRNYKAVARIQLPRHDSGLSLQGAGTYPASHYRARLSGITDKKVDSPQRGE